MTSERAIKKIRDFYNHPDNSDTRQLFDWAAKQPGARESTVPQVMEGADLDRGYVIYAMKELDKLRFGKFTVGRRNKKSRMTWFVDLGDLGRCAQGADIDFDEPVMSHGTPQGPVADAGESDVFILRPGVRISVPSDLTQREARQLAIFVLAIPDRTNRTDGSK
jgi:hypothetical protein